MRGGIRSRLGMIVAEGGRGRKNSICGGRQPILPKGFCCAYKPLVIQNS